MYRCPCDVACAHATSLCAPHLFVRPPCVFPDTLPGLHSLNKWPRAPGAQGKVPVVGCHRRRECKVPSGAASTPLRRPITPRRSRPRRSHPPLARGPAGPSQRAPPGTLQPQRLAPDQPLSLAPGGSSLAPYPLLRPKGPAPLYPRRRELAGMQPPAPAQWRLPVAARAPHPLLQWCPGHQPRRPGRRPAPRLMQASSVVGREALPGRRCGPPPSLQAWGGGDTGGLVGALPVQC